LLQHARVLLDIIQQEMADQAVTLPGDAREVLAPLRRRLESLERDAKPQGIDDAPRCSQPRFGGVFS
jgi:hypothetical protein